MSRRLPIPVNRVNYPLDPGPPNVWERLRTLRTAMRRHGWVQLDDGAWYQVQRSTPTSRDTFEQWLNLYTIYGEPPTGGLQREQQLTQLAYNKRAELMTQGFNASQIQNFLQVYVERRK